MLILEHIRQQSWKQLVLPVKAWSKHCDVVFCNDYFAPYIHLRYKTVQVFHDAFFYEYPGHYNRIWFLLFRYIAMPAARKSSFIIAPSNYARKTIHQHTHIPLEKIVPIYEGPKTLVSANSNPLLTPWLPVNFGYQYILHVGVLEKRKNLPALILAYKQLNKEYPNFKLVLAGQGNGKMHSDDSNHIHAVVRENNLEKEVLMPGYLTDQVLATVYQHAFMYVFPSINEGFGIPILEAFSFALPVLAANNTCLPEIGGDAILPFDPYDTKDIFCKMKDIIENETLRNHLKEAGKKRLAFFSWKKAAEELVEVFRKTAVQL